MRCISIIRFYYGIIIIIIIIITKLEL
jgi:hypothetical protein